jgi:AraC-like DNA-binding protein
MPLKHGRQYIHYDTNYWAMPSTDWPIYPFCVEESIRRDTVNYYEDGSRFFMVNLIHEGELIYSCGDSEERVIGAGGMYLIPQGPRYSFRTDGPGYYHKLVLEIKGLAINEFASSMGFDRGIHLIPENPGFFERGMRKIGALLSAAKEDDLTAALGATYEFMTSFSLASRGAGGGDASLLSRAKSLLEGAFDKDIEMPDVARRLGVSHSKLDKLFKKSLGMSPRQYRIQRKMEDARYLLKRSSMSVKELSAKLGYANQMYFANEFKRICGVSPSDCRSQSA